MHYVCNIFIPTTKCSLCISTEEPILLHAKTCFDWSNVYNLITSSWSTWLLHVHIYQQFYTYTHSLIHNTRIHSIARNNILLHSEQKYSKAKLSWITNPSSISMLPYRQCKQNSPFFCIPFSSSSSIFFGAPPNSFPLP